MARFQAFFCGDKESKGASGRNRSGENLVHCTGKGGVRLNAFFQICRTSLGDAEINTDPIVLEEDLFPLLNGMESRQPIDGLVERVKRADQSA